MVTQESGTWELMHHCTECNAVFDTGRGCCPKCGTTNYNLVSAQYIAERIGANVLSKKYRIRIVKRNAGMTMESTDSTIIDA